MVETSVILLNYNGLNLLKRSLPSVLNQTYKDYEIILVDNGSTDGSKEWVERQYPSSRHQRLKLKHIVPNRGFTGGNNYGVRFAKGRYVVLLSNDSVVTRTWLEELIKGLKREKDAGIVGSVVFTNGLEESMRNHIYRRHRASTMNLTGDSVMVSLPVAEVENGYFETFYVAGNTLAFRRDLWRLPFDEMYFIYAEDVYACWRARIQGWKVKTVLSSEVHHAAGSSRNLTKKVNQIAVFNGTKNQILNYLLFYRWYNLVRVLPLLMLSQIGHVLYDRKKFVVKLKACWWIVLNARKIISKRIALQRTRKVPDNEIIAQMSYKFFDDPWVLKRLSPFKRRVVGWMNAFFKFYCIVVRLKTREFPQR